MNHDNDTIEPDTRFDSWLSDGSSIAAITMKQWLDPIEGKGSVIFPPTYAVESGSPYNIDYFDRENDPLDNVCQIDSVGSQANRIEPIFKRSEYSSLIPKVTIKHDGGEIDMLDAGHRAADAIVRFSDLWKHIYPAFDAYKHDGNAEPLARIAPTSIVFGSWDSRATQVKLQRIVRSVIRAYRVKEMTRSAQYTTIAGEVLTDGEAVVDKKGDTKESTLGLAHVPAVKTHGGVVVTGEICREAILNLVVLRSLCSGLTKKAANSGGEPKDQPKDDERRMADDLKLRRYILGLSLLSFAATPDGNLREGCMLVPDPKKPSKWETVAYTGNRESLTLPETDKLGEYAQAAAKDFVVSDSPIIGTFDKAESRKVLAITKKEDRQAYLRRDPNLEVAKSLESTVTKAASKKSTKKTAAKDSK